MGGGGEGKEGDGTTEVELDRMMRRIPEFAGTMSHSEFARFRPTSSKFAAIVNTEDPPTVGHWLGVVANLPKAGVMMFFDPLGDAPPAWMRRKMAMLARSKGFAPHGPYQLKENRVRNQNASSDTCGYHVVRFLSDVISRGKSFETASGFDTLRSAIAKVEAQHTAASEREIRAFKKRYTPFNEEFGAKKSRAPQP
jgi:hypothetical protein